MPLCPCHYKLAPDASTTEWGFSLSRAEALTSSDDAEGLRGRRGFALCTSGRHSTDPGLTGALGVLAAVQSPLPEPRRSCCPWHLQAAVMSCMVQAGSLACSGWRRSCPPLECGPKAAVSLLSCPRCVPSLEGSRVQPVSSGSERVPAGPMACGEGSPPASCPRPPGQ